MFENVKPIHCISHSIVDSKFLENIFLSCKLIIKLSVSLLLSLSLSLLGRGCSAVVEHSPRDPEVEVSNPTGC